MNKSSATKLNKIHPFDLIAQELLEAQDQLLQSNINNPKSQTI